MDKFRFRTLTLLDFKLKIQVLGENKIGYRLVSTFKIATGFFFNGGKERMSFKAQAKIKLNMKEKTKRWEIKASV